MSCLKAQKVFLNVQGLHGLQGVLGADVLALPVGFLVFKRL